MAAADEDPDKVGPWSEVKLTILREYAAPYSKILSKNGFYHLYVDAFAGAGAHLSKERGERIDGSPRVALETKPPFDEYHFIDTIEKRAQQLSALAPGNPCVHIHQEDCNVVLPREVFPLLQWKGQRRRALLLLDPYGLHLEWAVLAGAGSLGTIEVFLNFPIMDINMNVVKGNVWKVDPSQAARLTRFWGDESWRNDAYTAVPTLFGEDDLEKKRGSEAIVSAFKKRLTEVAGFKFVADPLPMKTPTGVIVYYLFFASPNETGAKIVRQIFDKYRGEEA